MLELVLYLGGFGLIAWLNRERKSVVLWVSSVVYVLVGVVFNYVVYYGTDYSLLADKVVDGEPVSADEVPIAMVAFGVSFFLAYLIEPVYKKEKMH